MTSKTDWKILAKSKFGEFNLLEKYTQILFIQRIKQSNFFLSYHSFLTIGSMTMTEDEKEIFKNWKQFQLNEVKLILWHSFTDITIIPYYSSFAKKN